MTLQPGDLIFTGTPPGKLTIRGSWGREARKRGGGEEKRKERQTEAEENQKQVGERNEQKERKRREEGRKRRRIDKEKQKGSSNIVTSIHFYEGVGFGRTPQLFLKPGDVVRCEVEGVGHITNKIVLEKVWKSLLYCMKFKFKMQWSENFVITWLCVFRQRRDLEIDLRGQYFPLLRR